MSNEQHRLSLSSSFAINFTQLGKQSVVVNDISHSITAADLLALARSSLDISNDAILRLICGGKTIAQDKTIIDNNADDANTKKDNDTANLDLAFPPGSKIPKSGIVKIVVMGGTTTSNSIQTLNSQRSDPLMRGFDDVTLKNNAASSSNLSTSFWGPLHHRHHKKSHFRRLEECPDASFGTRPTSTTPHAFEAYRLLERLSLDPGILAIMSSRQLIVGTLGEMDPIDDVLMHKTHHESGGAACLLGYNTNHGLRIDIKLRTEDLKAFRPYRELVATLIHELSHNWVEEHNVIFWTNYGQMRIEYLWEHANLMMGGMFVNGKRTATLAGVEDMILNLPTSTSSSSRSNGSSSIINNGNRRTRDGVIHNNHNNLTDDDQIMNNIYHSVCKELEIQMTSQHQIPVALIAPGLMKFGNELIEETRRKRHQQGGGGGGGGGLDDANNERMRGQKLGGSGGSEMERMETATNGNGLVGITAGSTMTARERALAAAEKRRRETGGTADATKTTTRDDDGGASSKGEEMKSNQKANDK